MTTESTQISRRDVLKRGALVGGALWIAPAVTSLGSRAYAVGSPDVNPQGLCPPGTYQMRINKDSCVDAPAGNNTKCLGPSVPPGSLNGCSQIVSVDRPTKLVWIVRVRATTILQTGVQCDGWQTHQCVKGNPNGTGISSVNNGDGTHTITYDCGDADIVHPENPHGISHVELIFNCS